MTADTLALALFSVAGVLILYAWHRSSDDFDLRHLVVDSKTQRVSLMKCGQLFALLVSTWGFVVLVGRDKMTEFYFIGYMTAWSGANLLHKLIDSKGKE